MVRGMFNGPAGNPVPPMWLPYILVPDSPGLVKPIEQLGAKVINGPMEVPGGDWIVQGLDPQGAMFALHSKKKAA
jgi:predicted enzyme related to lactoylglutathione lyase